MPVQGWKRLLADSRQFEGEGSYPIEAYSEFMPPPRLGLSPYTRRNTGFFSEDDAWGWPVTEYEEAFELHPGMDSIAGQIIGALVHLIRGETAHGISAAKLTGNPYWSEELAGSGLLPEERVVLLLPLALSRTQDDKGRVRWTLFGGSELGPEMAFWEGFFTSPGRESSPEKATDFFRSLLAEAYGPSHGNQVNLRNAGFRIYPRPRWSAAPSWPEFRYPSWAPPLFWQVGDSLADVRYLLTFVPFAELPAPVRRAYLGGHLRLLPFPGSLLFWGPLPYHLLRHEFPLAMQIPLLHSIARHEGPQGVRVPQSGWMHEPRAGEHGIEGAHGPLRSTYIRTHRWARVHRHEDEIAILSREDRLAHVLFSTESKDVELYGKPMARNVQLWTQDWTLLLDGPRASGEDIRRAFEAVGKGGVFGYRFQFPAMRVGSYEVYWHRPLAACLSHKTGEPVVIRSAPPGYMAAYRVESPDPSRPLGLWPRILRREEHLAAVSLFEHGEDEHPHQTALNLRKLLDACCSRGRRTIPRAFARQLLSAGRHLTLEEWLDSIPRRANDAPRGQRLAQTLRARMRPDAPAVRGSRKPLEGLTYSQTARRSFEVRYWNLIRTLSAGKYRNKCNADCVRDEPTRRMLSHPHRDLEALGDYLLSYYRRIISASGVRRGAMAGEMPFAWKTDFEFDWYGGWHNNRLGHTHERNLIVVIPGRNRKQAIVMADHYDTAFMEDVYDTARGGTGARLAAAGADDNHSATAALMLAAPVFCRLSRERRLERDVWLIHLTGEEFPADCLGARHLASRLVERTLKLHAAGRRPRDLSGVRVEGIYVLDMVAHNNDRDRDVFQIAPGTCDASTRLASHAHRANQIWNESAAAWNARHARRERGIRSQDGVTIPAVAAHPELIGEIRPHFDPRSTLYNTDAQIFSDAGIPVVLFMENYDINRQGYHDTHDTMENIDLDYGAALVSIAIESVARAASSAPL